MIAVDFELVFEDAGHEVIGPCSTVEEAFEAVRAESPKVAVLDYNLGGMTTDQLAKRLAADEIPFVFLTGRAALIDETVRDLADEVLVKPQNPSDVLGTLSAIASARGK